MATVGSNDLQGKKVYTQGGQEVGVLEGIDVDSGSWQITTIEVKVRREVLEELKLKRPLIGTRTVRIPCSEIAGVADTVVLRPSLADLTIADREKEGVIGGS